MGGKLCAWVFAHLIIVNNIIIFTGVASYGALRHVPPSTSNNFIFVHYRVNLTADYRLQVAYRVGLVCQSSLRRC